MKYKVTVVVKLPHYHKKYIYNYNAVCTTVEPMGQFISVLQYFVLV